MMGRQVRLGSQPSAEACREACDAYASSTGSCTGWVHHGSRECLGLLDMDSPDLLNSTATASHGGTVRTGVAYCAAPMAISSSPPPPPREVTEQPPLLVLHVMASFSVSERVAARLALAHEQLHCAGHLHRVALGTTAPVADRTAAARRARPCWSTHSYSWPDTLTTLRNAGVRQHQWRLQVIGGREGGARGRRGSG